MKKDVREALLSIADEDLKKFTAKLIPNIDNIIGVRNPIMRDMAKKIAKQDNWKSYLENDEDLYYEETMVRGFIINYAKMTFEERLAYTKEFVPRINNWAVCDCFCYSVKEKDKALLWEFILPYLASDKPYDIRFGTIMILDNFVAPEYAERVFELFEKINHEDYYVKMGVAWTLSVFYVKIPELTLPFFRENSLDNFTHNKSLQKVIESNRVDAESKDLMRTLKRKNNKKTDENQ